MGEKKDENKEAEQEVNQEVTQETEGKEDMTAAQNTKPENEKKEADTINSEKIEELLQQILESSKKEAKHAKWAARFTFGLFLIFLVAGVILVPKVVLTLATVNSTIITAGQTIENANGTIDSVNEAIEGVNQMTGSITGTSENMNSMLTDNSQSLTDAVEKMNNIDFEGLNKAIQDLQDAVGPFANFMNRFR